MNFKDLIISDVQNVFLNTEEFADIHVIDGKPMPSMLDDIENIEREKRMKSHMDGLYVRQVFLYVAASDFGLLPAQGRLLKLDGKMYSVVDAADEGGVYTITLEANKSK